MAKWALAPLAGAAPGNPNVVGQRDKVFSAAQQAEEIRRNLAESRPHVFLPDLARSLKTLGRIYVDTGATASAAAAYRQGAESAAQALESNPGGVAPLLFALLRDYRSACSAAGVDMDSELSEMLAAMEAEQSRPS